MEAGVTLESVLGAVRGTAPIAAGSPCKEVDSKLPLSARASRRPKSAGACKPLFLAAPCTSRAPPPKAWETTELAAASGGSLTAGPPYHKLQERFATLQQLLEAGPDDDQDSIPAHPGQAASQAACTAGVSQAQQAGAEDNSLLLTAVHPTYQGQEGGELGASFRLDVLSLMDKRCEAAEARCQALVATRAEMTRALVTQMSAAVGSNSTAAQESAVAAMRGYETQLAALDARLSQEVRQVAQECQQAVAGLAGRVEAVQRANEEGMRKVNEEVVMIARRVGALSAQNQQ